MDRSDAIAQDLAALSRSLDEPGADLAQMVRQLGDSCTRAVASYTGFSITLMIDGMRVTFAALDDSVGSSGIGTSVMFPVAATAGHGTGSEVILYAATPGAFVDLAADLNYAFALGPDVVQLDRHLTPPDLDAETGLASMSRYHQALGILLDRGLDEDQARAELQRLANRDAVSLDSTAQTLLDSLPVVPSSERP